MEEMYHRCKTGAPMAFLFTTISGHVVEVKAEDLPVTSPYSPKYDPHVKVANMEEDQHCKLPAEAATYLKTKKLQIEELDACTTDDPSDIKSSTKAGEPTRNPSGSMTDPPLVVSSRSASQTSVGDESNSTSPPPTVPPSMVYNEYGELVSAHAVIHPPHSKDMTTLQILRIIKKGYHHNYRKKVGKVISEQMEGKSSLVVDDGSCVWGVQVSAWEFRPRSPKSVISAPGTSPDEAPAAVAVFNSPPRILEIGCGGGSWCFQVKAKYPDWIIEGVDDTDNWSCLKQGMVLRDFMMSDPSKPATDYFNTVHASQENPEFTVRNINQLLKHENPIPHNLYSLIRARDIFDKIESWKAFLEDVRLILQPDGVVEFLEVDPRLRLFQAGRSCVEAKGDHTSGPKTDWTDDIADRFKNKNDEQLGTDVPGWMGRVSEDLKASLRPRDGVPGPNLKSWLEGAGFWDVKQHIIRLPVGGNSKAGQLMKDFILFKHANEDEIPNLKAALPVIETEAIESSNYYLNLHIVTGRKPRLPRAGDFLLNGSRQEMTASKYEAMARTESPKSNQWKRFDLDGELTGLVHGLSNLSGAPSVISPPALNRSGGKISPLLTVDGASDGKGKGNENEKSEVVEHVEVVREDKGKRKEVEAVDHIEVAGSELAA